MKGHVGDGIFSVEKLEAIRRAKLASYPVDP